VVHFARMNVYNLFPMLLGNTFEIIDRHGILKIEKCQFWSFLGVFGVFWVTLFLAYGRQIYFLSI